MFTIIVGAVAFGAGAVCARVLPKFAHYVVARITFAKQAAAVVKADVAAVEKKLND
jgi:hypothetical protein